MTMSSRDAGASDAVAKTASGITLSALQAAHVDRQAEWCPDQLPDLSFRGNELAGEAGEASEALILHAAEISKAAGRASNVVKKLERERHQWRGSRASKADLAAELADVIHCAVLCAITAGIEIEPATVGKFNATSEKQGLATRIAALSSPAVPVPQEVRRLSEAATQGPWEHQAMMSDQGSVWRERFITDGKGNLADAVDPEDAEFIVAVVNWVRSLLTAPPAGRVDEGGESRHRAETELQEIADGAYGDNPLVRGAARDRLAENETRREAPGSAAPDDWRDDPSADDQRNAGLDFGMTQLCAVLGVDPATVNWDAATETLDGHVQSVQCGILAKWAGDDWQDAPRLVALASTAPAADSGRAVEINEPEARNQAGRVTVLPTALWRALDAEAELWSQVTDVAGWIAKMSTDGRSRAKLDAIVRLCFEEGFYRGAVAANGGRSIADSIQEEQARRDAAPAPAGATVGEGLTQAARDVLAERRRQVEVEGWTRQHDDRHREGEMALAAAAYAQAAGWHEDNRKREGIPSAWPWNTAWWKSTTRRRDLIKAGALILADIERLDRAAPPAEGA